MKKAHDSVNVTTTYILLTVYQRISNAIKCKKSWSRFKNLKNNVLKSGSTFIYGALSVIDFSLHIFFYFLFLFKYLLKCTAGYCDDSMDLVFLRLSYAPTFGCYQWTFPVQVPFRIYFVFCLGLQC